MKTITLTILGERFQIELEDSFYEHIKEELVKLQNSTPKELLFFILEKDQKEYELLKKLEETLNKN